MEVIFGTGWEKAVTEREAMMQRMSLEAAQSRLRIPHSGFVFKVSLVTSAATRLKGIIRTAP
jgi:hypothetical protein